MFEDWIAALERRHLAELTFAELSRALRALSATYVERRQRIGEGAALSGAGKRAAFALFYGPLHFLLVKHIVSALPGATAEPAVTSTLIDLGCGTGASGAAWAGSCAPNPKVLGIDRHPWAVKEAVATYREFGLSGRAVVGDVAKTELPKTGALFLAAFTLNELPDAARETLLRRLLDRLRGTVVEKMARRCRIVRRPRRRVAHPRRSARHRRQTRSRRRFESSRDHRAIAVDPGRLNAVLRFGRGC
jgi:hypothetical protein